MRDVLIEVQNYPLRSGRVMNLTLDGEYARACWGELIGVDNLARLQRARTLAGRVAALEDLAADLGDIGPRSQSRLQETAAQFERAVRLGDAGDPCVFYISGDDVTSALPVAVIYEQVPPVPTECLDMLSDQAFNLHLKTLPEIKERLATTNAPTSMPTAGRPSEPEDTRAVVKAAPRLDALRQPDAWPTTQVDLGL